MATGQGVTSKAAFKIETGAWGTAIAPGSGNQLHFISESVTPSTEYGNSVHLDGRGGINSIYNTIKKYAGELVIEAHYSGMEELFACAMGMSHQNDSPVSTSTDAYEHWFELSGDLSLRTFDLFEMNTPSGNAIRRGTLCFEKSVSVHENASTVFNSMTMEASPERVTFTFNVAAYAQDYDTSTSSDSSTWTVRTGDQILFDDMTVYLKARDEFTIAASNDNFIIDEGGGDVTLDIADGTYTGYELAQKIAAAANASGSLSGNYRMEYDETNRRFKIFTLDSQTFSVSGATMDMAETVGMTVDSTTALVTQSNYDAVPDRFTAFDSGDQVGVSKITVSLENNLDVETQDSESDLKILEPERSGMRRVTGSIEIPRYTNDDFLKAASGFTTYGLWIKFAGAAIDSETQELNLYLPQIKFTNAGAPIGGAEIIKQTLNFEAQTPVNFFDFVNFLHPAYTHREILGVASESYAVGTHSTGLWSADSGGIFQYWNGTSWTTSCDTSYTIRSIQSYNGDLYMGGALSTVFRYSSGVWSTSCSLGSSEIRDMVVYNDNLYAAELATGKIFAFDGTTWTTSCDTTATNMRHLTTYNGNLYAIGTDGSTFVRVYQYNDTTWTTSCDFGWTTNTHSLEAHRGKLYAHANENLYSFDGTTWTLIGDTGTGYQHMISYRGSLLGFRSAPQDIYILETSTGCDINIHSDFNKSPNSRPIIYDNTLLIPDGISGIQYVRPIGELAISYQNETSTNFL